MSTLRNHDGQIEHENDAVIEATDAVERIVEESRRKGRGVSRRHGSMTRTTGRRRYDTLFPFHRLVADSFNTTTTSTTSNRKREREKGNDLAVSTTRDRTVVTVEGEAA
jgi:hypothetical protein